MVTVSASHVDLTQLLECHRNLHSGGVDECEEQNIGAVLLVGMEFWFPVVIVRVEPKQIPQSTSFYCPSLLPGLGVVSQQDVHPDHFLWHPVVGP